MKKLCLTLKKDIFHLIDWGPSALSRNHFSLVELTPLKKSTKMYHFMGNPSQVTTHNLQQSRHIRKKKKKEALKSLRKVTLKIEPKVRVSNSSNRTAAALQQF